MKFFITGGSRGIGAGMVKDLAAAGHDVAFTYVNHQSAAQAVVTAVTEAYSDRLCRAYSLDVRDPEAVERIHEQVIEDFKAIDAVVLNAAITRTDLVLSMDNQDWIDVIDTNLNGPFWVCRSFLSSFLANGYGRFIHISSVSKNGMAGQAGYCASKAGLEGLSAALAKEYGRKNITSNVLCLNGFLTDMSELSCSPSVSEFFKTYCPVGRLGQFSEVSHAVLFLSSHFGAFINGAVLPVTGGLDWLP